MQILDLEGQTLLLLIYMNLIYVCRYNCRYFGIDINNTVDSDALTSS